MGTFLKPTLPKLLILAILVSLYFLLYFLTELLGNLLFSLPLMLVASFTYFPNLANPTIVIIIYIAESIIVAYLISCFIISLKDSNKRIPTAAQQAFWKRIFISLLTTTIICIIAGILCIYTPILSISKHTYPPEIPEVERGMTVTMYKYQPAANIVFGLFWFLKYLAIINIIALFKYIRSVELTNYHRIFSYVSVIASFFLIVFSVTYTLVF